MRLPKRIATVGLAGLVAGAVVGVPTASAAQNYAPQCDATASIKSATDYIVAYKLVCTDFSSTETVDTQGDINGGDWTAKAYSEGTFVKYSGKWYKAAQDAASTDEPTKPAKDDELNDIIVWVEMTTDTSAAWSSSSTASTATPGVFKAGYVVNYTPVGGSKGWYTAKEDTTAADVPGTSSKWEYSSSAYFGPQPAGSKVVSVKYSGLVSGYSIVSLNKEVLGFETEPPVLNAAGDAPARNQTQFCNGTKPSFGFSCFLQSPVNVYAKLTDNSYAKITGATLAVKSGSTYTDLKDTTFYSDQSASGTPNTTSASTDFLSIGLLGLPTNAGKKVVPAQSGSQIVGEMELTDDPCGWGESALRSVVSVTDPEGQVAPPIEIDVEQSRYYKLRRDVNGDWERYGIPKGCTFRYSWGSTLVYYRDAGGKEQSVPKPARKAPARLILAD